MAEEYHFWEAWCPECPDGQHLLGISCPVDGIGEDLEAQWSCQERVERHRRETGHTAKVRRQPQRQIKIKWSCGAVQGHTHETEEEAKLCGYYHEWQETAMRHAKELAVVRKRLGETEEKLEAAKAAHDDGSHGALEVQMAQEIESLTTQRDGWKAVAEAASANAARLAQGIREFLDGEGTLT